MNTPKHKHIFPSFFKKFIILNLCVIISVSFIVPDFIQGTTKDKLDEANNRLTELRQQQQALSDDFAVLNSKMDEISVRLALIEENISIKQSEVDKLNYEINELNVKKEKQYNNMKLRIKYMYENASQGIVEYMLASESISDALNRAEFFRVITEYNQDMIQELSTTLGALKLTEQSLATELQSLNELKAEAQKEADNIKTLIASTQIELSASEDDIAYFEQLCKEYEDQLKAEETPPNNQTGGSDGTPSYIDTPQDPMDYDATDLDMLAAILECEGGSSDYESLCAIASVIINRVNSPRFDNTISGVIHAPGQFSPVKSGRFALVLSRGAKPLCYDAAKYVLDGNITIDALYFRSYRDESDLIDGIKIGSNVFFKTWHK